MPEGSIAFPNEPLLRVTAPFMEALLLESGLLQAINLATLIATKASRVVWAARGRPVAEFALRRAQDPYVATRSSRIGGCFSTSFLGGAFRFRLPADGHRAARAHPGLPDRTRGLRSHREHLQPLHAACSTPTTSERRSTRRSRSPTRRAIDWATCWPRCAWTAATCQPTLATSADVLDAASLHEVRIAASGDLDEFLIQELLEAHAPIDSFGVGTSLGVGAGSVERDIEGAALGGVYKESFYEDELGPQPKIKVAGEKSTWPGVKEVYRVGDFEEDVIQLASEPKPARSERLLKPVVIDGEIVPGSLPPLSEIWELSQANLQHLPERYRQLTGAPAYPVRLSHGIREMRDRAAAELRQAVDESMEVPA